ncbi:MAG TPA: glycosyltransferase [Armatimonadota bacterium]|jgi:glycosyltransferase involved in cell wall biosynthesis
MPNAAPDTHLPKVLHLRSACGFYGAEGVIYGLVRAYAGKSATVCFADSRGPHVELCDALARDGFETDALVTRGTVDPLAPGRLWAILRRRRPDVIHAHDFKSAVAAVLAGGRRGLVFTVHGDLRETVGSAALRSLGCWALRRFHSVAAVSASTAADAREFGVLPERICLIRNGVDVCRFRPTEDRAAARAALGIPPDGFLIGAVGRLSEEKGHAILLDAFAALSQTNPTVRLAIAGDGPLMESLKEQATALGLRERVVFLGRREDAPAVYHALDALAQPSLREGLPLTVAEAGASGLPVVSTDVGDVSAVVVDGQTGYLAPPGEPAALAAALARLISAPDIAAAMGSAARRHVEERFAVARVANQYAKLYAAAAEAAR